MGSPVRKGPLVTSYGDRLTQHAVETDVKFRLMVLIGPRRWTRLLTQTYESGGIVGK